MATNTAGVVARQDPRNVQNILKRILNFNDADVAAAPLGSAAGGNPTLLPAGAFITDVQIEIVTAFNAGTTNAILLGTNSASFNNMCQTTDIQPNTAGVYKVSRGWGRALSVTNTAVYAVFSQSGTAATAGQAIITIEFEGGFTT